MDAVILPTISDTIIAKDHSGEICTPNIIAESFIPVKIKIAAIPYFTK
jgi:hypothetical protein